MDTEDTAIRPKKASKSSIYAAAVATDKDTEICWHCKSARSYEFNAIVFCDNCAYGYHQRCEGGPLKYIVPNEDTVWYCKWCRNKGPRSVRQHWTELLHPLVGTSATATATGVVDNSSSSSFSSGSPSPWNICMDDQYQLLNDDGPTPEYTQWVRQQIQNDPNFMIIYSFLDTFGHILGLDKVSFNTLEQCFISPWSSSFLIEALVTIITTIYKKASPDNFPKLLHEMITQDEYFETMFSDVVKLSKNLTEEAIVFKQYLKMNRSNTTTSTTTTLSSSSSPGSSDAVENGTETNENSDHHQHHSSSSSKSNVIIEIDNDNQEDDDRNAGAAERRQRQADKRNQQTHKQKSKNNKSNTNMDTVDLTDDNVDDDEDEEDDDDGTYNPDEQDEQFDYFAQPLPVRILIFRILCEETLTCTAKTNQAMIDYVHVEFEKGGAMDDDDDDEHTSGNKRKSTGNKDGIKRLGMEEFRAVETPISTTPLYCPATYLSTPLGKAPMPDYEQTLRNTLVSSTMETKDSEDTPSETVSVPSNKIGTAPGCLPGSYYLPSSLQSAVLSPVDSFGAPIVTDLTLSGTNTTNTIMIALPAALTQITSLVLPSVKVSTNNTATTEDVSGSNMNTETMVVSVTTTSITKDSGTDSTMQDTDEGTVHSKENTVKMEEDNHHDNSEAEISDIDNDGENKPKDKMDEDTKEEELDISTPEEANDERNFRYYFYQDCEGQVRLIQSRACAPFESIPRNPIRRKILVRYARSAIDAQVKFEENERKRIAEKEMKAKKEAEALAAKKAEAAARKAKAEKEAAKKEEIETARKARAAADEKARLEAASSSSTSINNRPAVNPQTKQRSITEMFSTAPPKTVLDAFAKLQKLNGDKQNRINVPSTNNNTSTNTSPNTKSEVSSSSSVSAATTTISVGKNTVSTVINLVDEHEDEDMEKSRTTATASSVTIGNANHGTTGEDQTPVIFVAEETAVQPSVSTTFSSFLASSTLPNQDSSITSGTSPKKEETLLPESTALLRPSNTEESPSEVQTKSRPMSNTVSSLGSLLPSEPSSYPPDHLMYVNVSSTVPLPSFRTIASTIEDIEVFAKSLQFSESRWDHQLASEILHQIIPKAMKRIKVLERRSRPRREIDNLSSFSYAGTGHYSTRHARKVLNYNEDVTLNRLGL